MYILVYLPSKLCSQPASPAANYGKREFYLFLFFFLTTFACSQPQCLLHTSVVKIIPSEALSFPQNVVYSSTVQIRAHITQVPRENLDKSHEDLFFQKGKTINNSTHSLDPCRKSWQGSTYRSKNGNYLNLSFLRFGCSLTKMSRASSALCQLEAVDVGYFLY